MKSSVRGTENDMIGEATGRTRRESLHARRCTLAAIIAAGALSACATDAALGPRDEHATMQIAATAMTASTIGQTVVIEAGVTGADGGRMKEAEIVWSISEPGVLNALGGGRFQVLKEGRVQVVAVWPKDPSVRAMVTVDVDAGLLASACIVKSDQAMTGPPKCAQKRVVVRMAASAALVAPADGPASVQIVLPAGGSR